ncbi:ATP-binding cassette sub-family C member 3 [Halotydeus destructor]|nr:ATP-binding cassette sub-family C member 3 [Halotydeus destructor]
MWFNGLVKKGYKTPLVMDDIYDLSEQFKSVHVWEKFSKHWSYPYNSNIMMPLIRTFWPRMILAASLQLLATIFTFVTPSALDHLLAWMNSDAPNWHGWALAVVMFVATSGQSLLNNHYDYVLAMSGVQMRTAIMSALHRKILKLSATAKAESTTGQIFNLMSVDSESIVGYVNFVNQWWNAPLQIAIAMYLLWQQLGIATLAGIAIMLLLIPVNSYLVKKLESTYYALMTEKDKRSKLMNEIISGIKVLKMYAWEVSLSKQVKTIRNNEIAQLKIQTILMALITFTVGCTPIFVAIFSFLTFTLVNSDNVLDPRKTFVSLALFNIIQSPLTMFPYLVNNSAVFSVAKKRTNKFLSSNEHDVTKTETDRNQENAIEIKNGKFSWNIRRTPYLRDINLNIKKKSLIAVVGRVGSGKSSLISALLGEMEKVDGQLNISGSVAYVPQQAWIQNATVKNNIVFTSAMDSLLYNSILDSCSLKTDLTILEAGDQTEIGEKGINLSGGQKQRVSLARAVYADRDIYLLDDPLSAVDSHVGKHMFEEVIGPKGVLKDTTRILVTHKVALLPHVDEIVVMKDGRISEQGTYLQLLQRKGAFADFLVEYITGAKDDEEDLADIKAMVRPQLERHISNLSQTSSGRNDFKSNFPSFRKRENSIGIDSDTNDSQGRTDGILVDPESAATGSVDWSVYFDYLHTIGVPSCIAILTVNAFAYGLNVASTLWLKAWCDDAASLDGATDVQLKYVRLVVYGVLGIFQAAAMFVGNLTTFYGTLRASKILHDNMLNHIIRAPMSFYDTTPSGRILNRFSKDIDHTDSSIRTSILQFVMNFFATVTTFSMITLQTPFFLPPLALLGMMYYIVQRYYIKTSRQLRRLESNSRSPLYSHFAETLSGTTSIRAFQVETQFNEQCNWKIDNYNATIILSTAAVRWLSIRLEFLGNLIVLLAALFAVYSRGNIDASTAGLSLSFALTATSTLNKLVTASADLENNSVSVERCIEYTKTPTEAPLEIELTKPMTTWPESGVIEFRDYAARYRDGLDLVLKNLNLSVKAGEKVGIVGRTGAGKSSLTVALFRIIEPANGTILIDGVDVGDIGLHTLRSGLIIIPQDPVLFTGSLRLNLDPLGCHDDAELWTALKLAHLQHFVDSLNIGLEFAITEGGENLSVGQRQLLCLARALLRKSKILILDEATAAVDLETDDLIQRTIRDEFADCTVLTIAHRLKTILDHDRVLVMDRGAVLEYDSPKKLLSNTESLFYAMVQDAGLSGAK